MNNRTRIRNLRKQAEALVETKRQHREDRRPCPACGWEPVDGLDMRQIDLQGVDILTGQPACEVCRDRRGRIQFPMPETKPDTWPDSPYWQLYEDDGPEAA